jgi:hypothetical protein
MLEGLHSHWAGRRRVAFKHLEHGKWISDNRCSKATLSGRPLIQ